MTWAMIFLLVILKIPVVYLGSVIWWAIKSERSPDAPAVLVTAWQPELGDPGRHHPSRTRRRRPGGPERRPGPRRAPARTVARG